MHFLHKTHYLDSWRALEGRPRLPVSVEDDHPEDHDDVPSFPSEDWKSQELTSRQSPGSPASGSPTKHFSEQTSLGLPLSPVISKRKFTPHPEMSPVLSKRKPPTADGSPAPRSPMASLLHSTPARPPPTKDTKALR